MSKFPLRERFRVLRPTRARGKFPLTKGNFCCAEGVAGVKLLYRNDRPVIFEQVSESQD